MKISVVILIQGIYEFLFQKKKKSNKIKYITDLFSFIHFV